ncbi:MAG: DoxX family protein [Acidobacteriales bacterium]|nr:DoxX family protein [Terriglobales bacterium]
MARKVAYWICTVLVALPLLFSGVMYLIGGEEVVQGFAHAGYPPYLRIVLGVAKPLAAIVLLLPGLALLKEWAYVGAAFAWIMATIAHYSAGDGPQVWGMPLGLLILLVVSYLTRPESRRLTPAPVSTA